MDKTIKLGLDTSDVKKEAKAAAVALTDIGDRLKKLRAVTVTPKIDLGPLQKAKSLIASIKGTQIGSTTIGAGLASGANSLIGAARALVSAATDLTVAGAKFALHASDFRGETEGAFGKLLGSSKAASALYEKVMDAAIATGMSQENAVKRAMGLLHSGAKFSQIEGMIKIFADLEKFKGEGKSAGLAKVFEKANASGKFDAKSIKGLAKEGISTASIYDELAKKLGKTRAQVKALFEKGDSGGKKGKGAAKAPKPTGVDAKTGIDAAMAVLKKRIGGVAAADSFADLSSGLSVAFARLFDKVDTSGVTKMMQQWLQILAGPEGKQLKEGVTELFTAIFNGLGALMGGGGIENQKKGIAGLADAMKVMAAGIKKITPDLKEVGSALSAVMSKASALLRMVKGFGESLIPAPLKLLMEALSGESTKKDGASEVKKKVDAIAKAAGKPITTKGGVPLSALDPAMASDAANTNGVGSNMAKGVQTGIESGKAGIVAALVSACQAAVSSAESSLQIRSPSRRLFGTGAQTSAGLAGGIRSGMGAVSSAMAAVSGSAAATANSNAYRATGTGGGGGSSGIRNMASSGGSSGGVSATFHYHPPSVSVPQGASPADTKAHTEAASTGAMAAFQSHFTDALRGLQET